MSEDDELDKHLFSIPKSSRKKKKGDPKKNPAADDPEKPAKKSRQDSGFDPLDLIELKGKKRRIVAWLPRHPQSSFGDLQEALQITTEDLERLLAELLQENKIQSDQHNGETTYSAPIHGKASRRLRGFPEDLWKKAGLDDE
jgi:predicted HTH transcriptional regulator